MNNNKVEINMISTLFFYKLFVSLRLTFIIMKMIKYFLKGVVIMIQPLNISWNKTKKNVEQLMTRYIYYSLSVDSNSTSSIKDDFLLDVLNSNDVSKANLNIDQEEQRKRIDFINYVRFSFNKLTTDERKIIYWTYFDKEDNYDDRFIANNLGFSLGYYYIKKKETLIRFACSLGVEEISDNK